MVLGDEIWTLEYVKRQIVSTKLNPAWLKGNMQNPQKSLSFVPPPPGWVKLQVDGSFHRPSSNMSCGGLMRDHHGTWVLGFVSFEGIGEVFLAELLAIIRGLSLAWERGIRKLICISDCEDVVKALTGLGSFNLYSCAAYLAEARSLINQEWEVSILHHNRERNKPADALAKLGMSLRRDFTALENPPPEIIPLMGCG